MKKKKGGNKEREERETRLDRNGKGRRRPTRWEEENVTVMQAGREREEETNSNVNGRGFVSLGQCAPPLDTRVCARREDVWKYSEI